MVKLERESVFPKSQQLRQVMEGNHGWGLYDLAELPTEKGPPEALAHIKPITEFKIGHTYIVLPLLQDGQTITDASHETKGRRPALHIDPESSALLETSLERNPSLAVFLIVTFDQDGLVARSPETKQFIEPDLVKIAYEKVVEFFEQSFFIAAPWEWQEHVKKKTSWQKATEELDHQIHWLPILDEKGHLTGVIDSFPHP